MSEQDFEYDVAISFASEDRAVAQQMADLLIRRGLKVFYDLYEQAELWGKDLYQHLQAVYRDKAQYCLIVVSASYSKKLWTKHELKQAQARAFQENREYILPMRLDDTEIPGINRTVGYVDMRKHAIEAISDMVYRKVTGKPLDHGEPNWNGE